MCGYALANVESLAFVSKRDLKEVFAKQKNAMETKFYNFLRTNESRFSKEQKCHREETLAQLLRYCKVGGDAHPAASLRSCAAASSVRLADRSRSARKKKRQANPRPQRY